MNGRPLTLAAVGRMLAEDGRTVGSVNELPYLDTAELLCHLCRVGIGDDDEVKVHGGPDYAPEILRVDRWHFTVEHADCHDRAGPEHPPPALL